MNTAINENNLMWVDLEMTGLDAAKNHIIEIAVLVTNPNLEILGEGLNLVIYQPSEILNLMDFGVLQMHTKTGLLEKVKESKITAQAAEKEILDFIKSYVPERKSPLCGNSVYMDRMFLQKYMPTLNEYLHYRNIDVSTIKELYRLWYPTQPKYEKIGTHTAFADIKESIEELKFYKESIFSVPRPS